MTLTVKLPTNHSMNSAQGLLERINLLTGMLQKAGLPELLLDQLSSWALLILNTPLPCVLQGKQRLATAFQAAPLQFPPAPLVQPAAFCWLPSLSSLVAAGGSSPNDLHRCQHVFVR